MVAAAVAAVAGAAFPAAAADTHYSLSYTITVASFTVGQVDAEARLRDNGGYALAIRGYTRGVSRLVSDATMLMASNGYIRAAEIQPYSFELETTEGGLIAQARMEIRSRTLTELAVYPGLAAWPDRVPLTGNDIRNVIDPLSAFLVPVRASREPTGNDVCNRTLPVFDGWQRFDIDAAFDRTEAVFSRDGSYAGPVMVCTLRYQPIAGHQESLSTEAVNQAFEAWMMPVEGTSLYLPYQIAIGTPGGSIVIRLSSLSSEPDTLGAIE